MFFHVHDDCRRRRSTSSIKEATRNISASTESKLDALACGANAKFPSRASSISNSKCNLLLALYR